VIFVHFLKTRWIDREWERSVIQIKQNNHFDCTFLPRLLPLFRACNISEV